MPDIRCPMCSKLNEKKAETCAFCGARLKPLVIDPASQGGRVDKPQETPDETKAPLKPGKQGTDWLGRLRSAASASDEPQESTPEETDEVPDWLDRLRPPERIGASEEGEQAFGTEDAPRADWLERLRKVDDAAGAGEEESGARDEDASAEEQELARADIPEWLEVMRVEQEDVADVEDDGAKELPEPDRWTAEDAPEPMVLDEDLEEDEEALELRRKLAMHAPEPETPDEGAEEDDEVLELRRKLAMHAPEPETHEEGVEEDADVLELRKKLVAHAPEPGTPDEGIQEDEEILDLREKLAAHFREQEILGEGIAEEGQGFLADSVEEAIAGAPQTPALILDDEAQEEEPQDIDLEQIKVPEWIAGEQAPEAAAADVDAEEKPSIERAVLPRWLAAMRPIESFRTQEEEEGEGEQPQSIETIGPLAGLSGVLMAEPLVAMPRAPGVIASGISISKQEDENVRILRRLVEAERREIAPTRPHLRAGPVLHWMVALLLAAAVILPQLVSGSIFPAPRWVPQDLETLRSLVEELPVDRPALLVVDYDPGYAAELEAVGSSLLDHLFQRGMSVVTLSTRAAGPALAQRLIDHVSDWHSIEVGENYLHLGYLAGGPTAVQLFSTNPQYGNMRGFLLPEEREWSTPWQAPILSEVQHLSDFGVVVVVTAGTETARTWAEQAAPQAGETPFIMVLSAGAEPLVRPYYANPDPQVDAIYTGLPSAKANELLNGHSGDASLLWDAFGMGGWAAIAVLVVGGIMGLITSLLRGRAKDGSSA